MPEYNTQSTPRPATHEDFADHLAAYLHSEGVCADPTSNQEDGDAPAVFIGRMLDQPDRAVCIFNVSIGNDWSDSNPTARFSLAFRGAPEDQLTPARDAARAMNALHDLTDIQLTAQQGVLVCRRVLNDPQVPDSNIRWHSIDTYEAVLAVPSTP